MAPASVDDVGEQKRLAFALSEATTELPADQRMKLGVIVDRLVDPEQQVGRFQRLEMFVQICITGPWPGDHRCLLIQL